MARARNPRWTTWVENDFTLGVFRDGPRLGIPKGGLYDCTNGFVHRPGVIFKRGGVTFAGPVMTDATGGLALISAPFPSGPQLVALGNDFSVYTVTDSTTTKVPDDGSEPSPIEKPTFFSSGAESIVVFCDRDGNNVPVYYDGEVSGSSHAFAGGATNILTGGAAETAFTISLVGSPSGGSFRLSISLQVNPEGGDPLLFITASIAWNASAANVVTAINNALAATGVTVTSSSGGSLPATPVVVTMPAGYTIAPWISALTPSGYPTVTNTTSGSGDTIDEVSVPEARFSTTHLERLVLGNSATYPSRIWFSPFFNVTKTGWDLANAWWDFDAPITGLASFSQQLLVFTANGFHRVVGTTPPGLNQTSDMDRERMSEVGCTDARSITVNEGRCIYANPNGVFVTTGVAPVSLMEGRVESYWQSLFSGYQAPIDGGSWVIAAGVHARRFLFVSVIDGDGNLVQNLCCDLPRLAWTFHGTFDPLMYAHSVGVDPDLFFVNQQNKRVYKLGGLFEPSSANAQDVGMTSAETPTDVELAVETRAFA